MLRLLELKIPPPVVAVLTGLAMWAFADPANASGAVPVARWILCAVLALAGAAFDLSGLVAFRRARTTINPLRPDKTSSIVQAGIYRLTRNPMYVGLTLFLCAWAAYLWSWWALIGPAVFVAYITRFQILPEERVLAASFGEAFEAYRNNVRRWL